MAKIQKNIGLHVLKRGDINVKIVVLVYYLVCVELLLLFFNFDLGTNLLLRDSLGLSTGSNPL
jgi:hypothetical protein